MTARAWPAKCASCGRPVRKAESHRGAPGSGIAVRHLACAAIADCSQQRFVSEAQDTYERAALGLPPKAKP